MKANDSGLSSFIGVIRWIARIAGLLAVLLVLAFELPEAFSARSQEGQGIPVVMITGSLMMMGGLLAAWKWEFWGGLVSLAGFFIIGENNPRVWDLPLMYILFMTPAILFIITGLAKRFFRKS